MKTSSNSYIHWLVLLSSILSFEAFAQPAISWIAPNNGIQGQSLSVQITGLNTNFEIASGSGTINNVSSVYLSHGSTTIVATSFSATNATNVTANFTLPSNAMSGKWDVNVMPITGGLLTMTNGFVINNAGTPTISSIAPNNGIQGQLLAVQITGLNTNFEIASGSGTINNVSSVYLSHGSTTIAATSFSATSATNVTANFTIPSTASLGNWNVNIMPITGGLLTMTNGFVVNAGAPTISWIAPNNGIQGQSLSVQITGLNTNFEIASGSGTINNVSSVYLSHGSTTIAATSFSATSATNVTANFTIPSTASLGNWNVNIMPITGGLLTLTNGFVVNNAGTPTISSIAPNNGIQGQSLSVQITGLNTNFEIASGSGTINNVSSVYLSHGSTTIVATSFSATNATNVTANFTLPSNAMSGKWDVNVMPITGGLLTMTNGFVINNAGTPTISSIAPNNGIQGQLLAVQITGLNTNFEIASGSGTINNVSSVYLSHGSTTIAATSFSATSATNVTANFTIPSTASLGNWNVNIMPITGGLLTMTNGFVVNAGAPTISWIAPNNGIQGQSLSVQITGLNTNFEIASGSGTINNVSSVYLSHGSTTIAATSFSATSATNVTANFTIPSTASLGNWNVNIMPITGGLLTMTNGFVIYNAQTPIISSIVPNTGIQGQSLAVQITGLNTNFEITSGSGTINNVSSVYLSQGSTTIIATSFSATSATNVTANFTIPSTASLGNWNVNIMPITGGLLTMTNGFVIYNAQTPIISSIVPNTGIQGQSLAVQITGLNTNFEIASGSGMISNVSSVYLSQGSTTIVATSFSATSATNVTANFTIPSTASLGNWNVNIVPIAGGLLTMTNGFVIYNAQTPIISSIVPNTGIQGQSLAVQITGLNTNFEITSGSGTINNVSSVYLSQGSTTIIATSFSATSATNVTANFTIPSTASLGNWNVNIMPITGSLLTMTNGFIITSAPTPIISSIVPNSSIQGQSLSVQITGLNTNFEIASGNGTINNVSSIYLSQGSTTIVATSFSATSATKISANFTIPSTASLGSWDVNVMPVTGSLLTMAGGFSIYNAQTPIISLSTSTIVFGSVTPGNTAVKSLVIANTGGATLTGSVSVTSNAGFSINKSTINIAAGGQDSIIITFSPTSAQDYSALLTITHNAPGSPSTVTLSGTGINSNNGPLLSLSPSSLLVVSNGNFSSTTIGTITVINNGSAALTGTISWSGSSMLSVSPGAFNIAAGGSSNITISISSVSVPDGDYSGSIMIIHNAPGSPALISIEARKFSIPLTITASNQFTFSADTSGMNYKLIGIPGMTLYAPSTIFSGTYKQDWRMYLDNGSASNYLVEYDGSSNFYFGSGKGFWVLSDKSNTISATLSNYTSTGAFPVFLQSGWNIISNPYALTVMWNDVVIYNRLASNSILYSWNNGVWSQAASLVPYAGYYFDNTGNASTLSIPYDPSGAPASQNILAALTPPVSDQHIKISISTGNVESSNVYAAFDEHAGNHYNQKDYFAPPASFAAANIQIEDTNLSTKQKRLWIEHRASVGEGQRFHLVVKNTSSVSSLTFEGIDKFPNDRVYLLDEKRNELFDLRLYQHIDVPVNSAEYRYSLLIGGDKFIDTMNAVMVPTAYSIAQNYPNPFNPATTIEYTLPQQSHVKMVIYDIMGRQVATLVDGYKSAGRYSVIWNASHCASGVYFCRLTTGSYSSVKKMLLMK